MLAEQTSSVLQRNQATGQLRDIGLIEKEIKWPEEETEQPQREEIKVYQRPPERKPPQQSLPDSKVLMISIKYS